MPVLSLLLDHNVPTSVAEVFLAHGHTVTLVRQILPTDTPDPIIAKICEDDGLILVSIDRDFKQMIRARIPEGYRTRFRKLCLISLQCSEPQAAQRISKAMSFIEAEYEISQQTGNRMHLAIQDGGMKTHR